MTKTVYSPKMQTFDYTKEENISNVGEEWQVLAELKTPRREFGAYLFGLSMSWRYDRTTSSADFGFSNDGGKTWFDFHKEPTDITDVTPFTYFYPFDSDEAIHHFIFRGKKEAGQGDLDIIFIDMFLERKG